MGLRPKMSPLNPIADNGVYASGPFVGRQEEQALLDELLVQSRTKGAALVIRGDVGVGKSALLDEARRRAIKHGFTTSTIAAAQSEAHLTFAGLHQLLKPALAGMDTLPVPQRSALQIALGLEEGDPPELLYIALASLELLSEMASAAPLLVIVDDVQWLDAATCDVLTFVARRLTCEPILMLFGVRDVAPVRYREGRIGRTRTTVARRGCFRAFAA